jgi:LacI family transcriptional regulator
MTNIKDVAVKAGVSITTVSHVINETRYVSDDLKARVYSAMEALNYRPNTLARSLRSGRSRTIGLVIPDISNLFFAEISRKIEDKGFEYGYSVILCNTDDNREKEKSYIDVLLEKQVDGIIFISAGAAKESVFKPKDVDIPIVVADRDIPNLTSDIVLIDNHKGGYDATSYLISLNHKRIACIAGASPVTPSALRVEGYKHALEDAGISVDEILIRPGDFRYESGETCMLELLKTPNPPTAVFVCNDMMALGAIRGIQISGKKIPEDISLVGFDNIPLSRTVYPALTTMAQPIVDMAEVAVNLLVDRIQIKQNLKHSHAAVPVYKRVILQAQLIERESCAKLIKL